MSYVVNVIANVGYADETSLRPRAHRFAFFDPAVPPADRAKNRSLFFDDLLDAKLREFNPRYAEGLGALLGQFRHLHTDIYANRGGLINMATYVARYCDKSILKSLSRHLLRLD